MRYAVTALLLALSLSCASGGPAPDPEQTVEAAPPAATPESEIGLAPGQARQQPPQAPIAGNTVDPGDSELRARPNDDFPPVIPHTVADLETITLQENSCMDCHDPAVADDFEAVAIPESHRVDLRHAPNETGDSTVGARWVCTSCHVVQTDARPLVGMRGQG